ncbi:Protein serine/threonine phosphatase PrpC, regulation of stationary phase [Minicystis rosea]|nr:Protein serine/threonine phosphatase PrpC, regulation of stationary phase [Minicystis rosea]
MIHLMLPSVRQSSARTMKRAPLRVRSFGASDQGRVRDTNEDRFLIMPLTSPYRPDLPGGAASRGHLFAVADGMGGALAGETASALAIAVIEELLAPVLCADRAPDHTEIVDALRGALDRADARLLQAAEGRPDLDGMGTTLTVAYSRGRRLFVAHVGDSRCYLLREGVLRRLTNDHTFVQEMVRQGVLPPERAAHHGLRHVLSNAVGANTPPPDVELTTEELMPGDTLLLCTDGLTDMLSDDDIAVILDETKEPVPAGEMLIEQANDRGGRDNVTVVVARYESAP